MRASFVSKHDREPRLAQTTRQIEDGCDLPATFNARSTSKSSTVHTASRNKQDRDANRSAPKRSQLRRRCYSKMLLDVAVPIRAGTRRQVARFTQNPDARHVCIARFSDRVRGNVGQEV